MGKLPVISGDEFVKAVDHVGYSWDHTEGSHMILLNKNGRRLVVPRHKELGPGLLRKLIREVGISRTKFIALLKK